MTPAQDPEVRRPHGAPPWWPSQSAYLGDGLYAAHDGYHLLLGAHRDDGWHWVGLEPIVLAAMDRLRARLAEPNGARPTD